MEWNFWIAPDDVSADALLASLNGSRREPLARRELKAEANRRPQAAHIVVGTWENTSQSIRVHDASTPLAAFLSGARAASVDCAFFLDLGCTAALDPFAGAEIVSSLLECALPGEAWVVAMRPLPLHAPHPLVRWLTDVVAEPCVQTFDDDYEALASSSHSGRSAPSLGRAKPSFELRFEGSPHALSAIQEAAPATWRASAPVECPDAIDDAPMSLSIIVDIELPSSGDVPNAVFSMSSNDLSDIPSLPAMHASSSGPDLDLASLGSWVGWDHDAEALLASDFENSSWFARLDVLMARSAIESRRTESLLARLIDALARQGQAKGAGVVCRHLAILRRDALHDTTGAIEAFRGAIRCAPLAMENHNDLASLLTMGTDTGLAVVCLDESLAVLGPVPEFLVLRRTLLARIDSARSVLAGALAAAFGDLRFSTDAESLAADAPMRPARILTAADWALLRHPDMSTDVTEIFCIVEAAALEMRSEEKRLVPLPAGALLDPQGTATIVRTVAWASQILGLPQVPVHHVESTRHDLIAHPGPPASVVVGPGAISGRSLVDLSFLAARHLTYYLPGHCISLQYVSVDELAMLFWAAVLTGREEIPPALREATATMRWREGLRARLSSSQKALLVHAVARVENGGGRVDVASWVKGVEYTANRLGLLLAGDPSRVVAMVTAEERRVGGLNANHRLTDLAVWGASEAHAKLRASLTQRI